MFCIVFIVLFRLCIFILIYLYYCKDCRSQWPRGLRRRSAAARLLRLWVRIPPGAWMSVCLSVVYCQVEVPAMGWSLVQMSPTDCGVLLCVISKNKPREWGGQDPVGGYRAKRKKISSYTPTLRLLPPLVNTTPSQFSFQIQNWAYKTVLVVLNTASVT